MNGSLTKINLSDLIVDLYFTRRTGILRVSQGDVKKSLYFKEGSIVFAHSNLKHERLGEVLLRLGKITEEEFNSVLAEIEEGRRLGRVLHEKGYVSESDITAGVAYQLQQIAYSIFNWDQGEYEFVDRDRPVYEDIMVDVSTPNILIEGIRNITNPTVLERAIGKDENRLVTLDSGSVRRLPRTNLDFSEETILSCVDGKSSLSRLRELTHLQPLEFNRAMYMLMLSGMIGLARPISDELETELRAQVQKRWTAFSTQPIPPSIPENLERTQGGRLRTLSEPELRRLIVDTEKEYQTATDEQILRVLPDCTKEEIQNAYDRLCDVFHPPYYSFDRYQDLKAPLKAIIDRMLEAYGNLMGRVQAQEPPGEPLPAPAPVLKVDPGQVILEESRPLVTPQLPETPKAPVMESSVQEIEMDLGQPPPPPAPVCMPPQPEPEPAEAVEAEPQGDLNLTELEAAIKAAPYDTALLRQLGRKLQQSGRARDGEKYILRALEIEPQNVENHFALAEFYNVQGLKFKVFKHLNIILQLEPNNQRAMHMLGVKKRKKALYDITPGSSDS